MTSRKTKAFQKAVSNIRSAARRRVRSKGMVSAVDLSNVASNIKGEIRGAAVRTAFNQLVAEDILQPSGLTVYNPNTHHRVAVYKPC